MKRIVFLLALVGTLMGSANLVSAHHCGHHGCGRYYGPVVYARPYPVYAPPAYYYGAPAYYPPVYVVRGPRPHYCGPARHYRRW
jgi:hypothetical protein